MRTEFGASIWVKTPLSNRNPADNAGRVAEVAHDLAVIIDTNRNGSDRARHIDRRKGEGRCVRPKAPKERRLLKGVAQACCMK